MAFGHTLFNDNEGNYKGPLMLNLKEGYVSYLCVFMLAFCISRVSFEYDHYGHKIIHWWIGVALSVLLTIFSPKYICKA